MSERRVKKLLRTCLDFQKDWALCHLLELHDARDDYAMVLERHDDVAVLDSPVDPQQVDVYQIKTKESGDWTLTQLLKIEKSKATKKEKSVERKRSYLAKMYTNRIVCQGHEMTTLS